MFTGIIHYKASLVISSPSDTGRRLTFTNPFSTGDLPKLGDSIAINGCCLTVCGLTPQQLAFDAIPETLAKTNLGGLTPGKEVHVERSLRAMDRIDGHFVQGHVDGVARVNAISTANGEWRMTLEAPGELAKFLVPKGSVALDGVSLTIARIDGPVFDVTLIPTTLDLTTLGQRKVGDMLNLECDATVKTIVTYLERMGVGK